MTYLTILSKRSSEDPEENHKKPWSEEIKDWVSLEYRFKALQLH